MKTRIISAAVCACLVLALAAPILADDRPHEGKIISIDKSAMVMVVQDTEKDDQFTLYWTESTKLKGDVTIPELKVGDRVHFAYMEKDGKMWVTELKRSEKAKT